MDSERRGLMADANPTKLSTIKTLPEGKGNYLEKVRCPKCDTKRSFWREEGDPGCEQCAINDAKEAKKPKK